MKAQGLKGMLAVPTMMTSCYDSVMFCCSCTLCGVLYYGRISHDVFVLCLYHMHHLSSTMGYLYLAWTPMVFKESEICVVFREDNKSMQSLSCLQIFASVYICCLAVKGKKKLQGIQP